MPDPIITLTTDFGEGSPYVAEMKGVILSIQPAAQIIDITHAVPPQDIFQGALVLEQTTPRFPPDSIHVAVVDPGVGTERKIVYACIDRRHYVAPDNGLLGLLARRHPPSAVIALANRAYWRETVSNTFHGRDIMAPIAAHVGRGVHPADLGPALADLTPLDWPEPAAGKEEVTGAVCSIDAFGNLITNLESGMLQHVGPGDTLRVYCGGRMISGLVTAYGDRPRGELVALIGSNGCLEIAVVGGSAKAALRAEIGEKVVVLGRGRT